MNSWMEITLVGILLPLAAWLLSGLIFLLFQCGGGGFGADPHCSFVSASIAAEIGKFYWLSMIFAVTVTPISTVAYLLLNVVWWVKKPKRPS